jgi:predicted phosphodiesterase
MENILATTTAGQLDAMLAGQHAGVLAGGHTHIQMLRQHRGMLVVNAGSVGMPFEEFVNGREPRLLAHAEYAIVDARGGAIGVELRRVPLSRAALCAAAAASALPMRDMLIEQYS